MVNKHATRAINLVKFYVLAIFGSSFCFGGNHFPLVISSLAIPRAESLSKNAYLEFDI